MSTYCKYKRTRKQYSDDGVTWVDIVPPIYGLGDVIQCGLASCIDDDETQYRYVVDGTICHGFNKYQQLKEQKYADNQWVDTGIVKDGNLIETNSADCGYGEKWVEVSGEYICQPYVNVLKINELNDNEWKL